jgi:hypothetical protein
MRRWKRAVRSLRDIRRSGPTRPRGVPSLRRCSCRLAMVEVEHTAETLPAHDAAATRELRTSALGAGSLQLSPCAPHAENGEEQQQSSGSHPQNDRRLGLQPTAWLRALIDVERLFSHAAGATSSKISTGPKFQTRTRGSRHLLPVVWRHGLVAVAMTPMLRICWTRNTSLSKWKL